VIASPRGATPVLPSFEVAELGARGNLLEEPARAATCWRNLGPIRFDPIWRNLGPVFSVGLGGTWVRFSRVFSGFLVEEPGSGFLFGLGGTWVRFSVVFCFVQRSTFFDDGRICRR
jgi:hypothetical protein